MKMMFVSCGVNLNSLLNSVSVYLTLVNHSDCCRCFRGSGHYSPQQETNQCRSYGQWSVVQLQ